MHLINEHVNAPDISIDEHKQERSRHTNVCASVSVVGFINDIVPKSDGPQVREIEVVESAIVKEIVDATFSVSVADVGKLGCLFGAFSVTVIKYRADQEIRLVTFSCPFLCSVAPFHLLLATVAGRLCTLLGLVRPPFRSTIFFFLPFVHLIHAFLPLLTFALTFGFSSFW